MEEKKFSLVKENWNIKPKQVSDVPPSRKGEIQREAWGVPRHPQNKTTSLPFVWGLKYKRFGTKTKPKVPPPVLGKIGEGTLD